MQETGIRVIEADAGLGGGRYDFAKIPPSALKALYARKDRNVYERARFLAMRGHQVVGFMLADFRVLVSGKQAVFITTAFLERAGDNREAAGILLLAAMTWANTLEEIAYVKVESPAFLDWSY